MSSTIPLMGHTAKSPDHLSTTAKMVGSLFVLCIVGGTWSVSPLTVTLLPLIFALTGLVLYYRSTLPATHRSPGSLETLFWMYLGTGTVGTLGLLIVQSILAFVFAYALFGSEVEWFFKEFQNLPRDLDIPESEHKATRAAFAARPSYWVFILLMTFILAAVCEEGLKYFSIMVAKWYRRGSFGSHREYLIYGAFSALSFGTIENIMFVATTCQNGSSVWELSLTVFERVIACAPGHMLCGVSIALGVIRRDELNQAIRTFDIMKRSMLCHGLWDMTLMSVSALNGNLGWVHPTGLSLAVCYVSVLSISWLLWRSVSSEIRTLKIE